MDNIENDFVSKKPKSPKNKKTIIAVIVFIIGIATLVTGVVFLVLKLVQSPAIADGEYLISAKNWVLEGDSSCSTEEAETTDCTSGVIWDFTEIGKGTLTTNNHINDYDFIWALEDGKLKIETKWLYDLENEYEYNLNQNDGILTLTSGDETIVFKAVLETE